MQTITTSTGTPPKIGYVLKRFPRLSETFILNELLELERQGAEVEVFALKQADDEPRHAMLAELKAHVTYLPASRDIRHLALQSGNYVDSSIASCTFKSLTKDTDTNAAIFPGKDVGESSVMMMQAASLAAIAKARGIQHLHAHFATDATTIAMLASRFSGIPYSITAHAKDIFHTYTDKESDNTFLVEKIRQAAFVVTVSDYNQRYLTELAGPDSKDTIHRLYNGINLSRFKQAATHREPNLILTVSRLVEKKGFSYLVEACRLLRDAGHDFRCLIVGNGPEYDALRRQIDSLGLEEQVCLEGGRPSEEVRSLMESATMFVLPCVIAKSGDRDGLPTVLLEALASGLPAISTAIIGIPEIIEDGTSGLLVPPEDPQNLAKAMARMLEGGPEFQKQMACNGRTRAENLFDLRKNVATLLELYKKSIVDPPQIKKVNAL